MTTQAPGSPAVAVPPVSALSRARLSGMLAAGAEVMECHRVLTKAGLNIVGEVLRGQGTFYEYEHYPAENVYDPETHSQYYYHAHRGIAGEHGHFHTFLRARGMPDGVSPARCRSTGGQPSGTNAVSHLVAISMDAHGLPIGLFAVNRWVTGDTWCRAADVVGMLQRFSIDHARPSWPVNRWITAMLRLFHPQIAALLRHRDQVIHAWTASRRGIDVLEERSLEVTGFHRISVAAQVAAVRRALRGR